jgi:hypothetical protein
MSIAKYHYSLREPDHVGAWVRKERGSRRLLPVELARGLGVPKEWELSEDGLTDSVLSRCP